MLVFLSCWQEFIRLGCLSKLSGKGLQQRMFFLVIVFSLSLFLSVSAPTINAFADMFSPIFVYTTIYENITFYCRLNKYSSCYHKVHTDYLQKVDNNISRGGARLPQMLRWLNNWAELLPADCVNRHRQQRTVTFIGSLQHPVCVRVCVCVCVCVFASAGLRVMVTFFDRWTVQCLCYC